MDFHQNVNIGDEIKVKNAYREQNSKLQMIDTGSDIEWWSNNRGLGVEPNWPAFTEYDPDSMVKTISTKQSTKSPQREVIGETVPMDQSFNSGHSANMSQEVFVPHNGDSDRHNNNKPSTQGLGLVEALYKYDAEEDDE